jgi:hypothetical protein
MLLPVDPTLSRWENYYVIVGSAAAALIGIQFVVITLIGSLQKRTSAESIRAFGTPTVVHLATALVISAVMTKGVAPAGSGLVGGEGREGENGESQNVGEGKSHGCLLSRWVLSGR